MQKNKHWKAGGGVLGGEGEFDLGDEAGEELGGEEELAPEEAPPGEESSLLAAPGKRDDRKWIKVAANTPAGETMTTTSKSKGKWYKPEKSDKRNMGARKRNYKSKYSHETGKNTKRNIFKGYSAN